MGFIWQMVKVAFIVMILAAILNVFIHLGDAQSETQRYISYDWFIPFFMYRVGHYADNLKFRWQRRENWWR